MLALYEAKKSSAALARHDGMNGYWYWSGTPVAGYSSLAWDVNFYFGSANGSAVSGGNRVRCVR